VLDTHDSFGQHLHPLQTTQDIDADGQVKKSETIEKQDFFVNGLGGHPKTGHLGSLQNRPLWMAET
jgi:hypothetical protein